MAVSEQTPYVEYTATGVTNNFALEFTCDSKQELKVFIDNVEPELSTWSLVGGSVVFTTAPVSGSKIVLKRATKLERTTNYSSVNNSFRPDAINKDFDRVWYALQDQAYKLGKYDLDYSYAINTSNQALGNAATAQQKADSAYTLANTTNTETRPIERGGTGASTAAGARTNLSVYSQDEVDILVATGGQGFVAGIANGGTGSTTAAGARTNLDVYSKTEANDLFIENTEKGTPNGIAPLDANMKVDPIYFPTIPHSGAPQATETQIGVAEIATQAEVNAATDDLRIITPKKLLAGLKNHLNASGNAPIYACRAWVNFNGIGTVEIRGSGNVSSITDNGTGDYTINFTTAMQDANYAISGNATQNSSSLSSSANVLSLKNATNGVLANKSTTSFTIVTVDNSSDAYFDSNNVSVAVFR